MAFDWVTNPTGVIYRIGRIVSRINSYNTLEVTTLPADLKIIADPYEAADMTAQIPTVFDAFTQQQSQIQQFRQLLARFIDATIQDPVTVLDVLGVLTTDVQAIVAAIIEQALIDAKTFQKSVVTVGSVTAPVTPANKGTGFALVTTTLDGYNAPLSGGQANLNYRGLLSELAVPTETMLLQCVGDSMTNSLQEGAESWNWSGALPYDAFDWHQEGSGQGPGLTTGDGYALVTDGNFENWSGDTPSNWTIDAGAATTNIVNETATVFRGTHSAKFVGTGAAAAITLGQAISPATLQNRRRDLVGVWMRGTGVPAAGNIVVKFTGTGYTAASATDEIQTLQISGTPSGGTYAISWAGPYGGTQTTAAVAYNATSATVQAALRLLTGLESVVVTTSAGAPPNVTHQIVFSGVPGPLNQITADITGLTGGAPAKAIATPTPGVLGEQINLPAAAFPVANTWVWRHFWVNMPDIIPSDFRLIVSISGTLSAGTNVYFDSLVFVPVTYHGGVGCVVIPGATRFLNGDRLTFTLANAEGVAQAFFRKWYKAQLPSAAAPVIADGVFT